MSTKVFIVGSPRSGTTLLQSMMASHSLVFSLPETFFFVKAMQGRYLKRRFLWPAIKVRRHLRNIVLELGREDLLEITNIGLFRRDYARPFVELLDRLTNDSGKTVWVEKTPWHLRSIEEISKQVPDSVFIHVIRDGRDVVASLYNAVRSHTDSWARLQPSWYPRFLRFKPYSIEDCVSIWNTDIAITRSVGRRDGHYIVSYEELVANPEVVMKGVAEFVGIDFQTSMLNPETAACSLSRANELWKSNNTGPVRKMSGLFDRVFDLEQQDWVIKHLDMDAFEQLNTFSCRRR